MENDPLGLENSKDFEASLVEPSDALDQSRVLRLAQSNPPPSAPADPVENHGAAVAGSSGIVSGTPPPRLPSASDAGPSGKATPTDDPQSRWLGKKLSHFRIMRVMGQGTMGVVFQVEDVILKRIAALKVLRRRLKGSDRSTQIDRFLLEARAAAAIDHPCIAQIYEINQHDGWWYIAMEYLEGSSLQHILSRSGPMPPGRAALVLADAARGLAAAHEAGIIHRDVKPANLMLTRRGRCKVVDFGLVKLDSADNPFRDDDVLLGTPYYMAPEIILHKGATPLSDIYSLGATLYALLTGVPPFRGDNLKEVLRKHVEADPPDAREAAPHLPQSVALVIKRSMSKIAEQRPTAEEFAALLQGEVTDSLAAETPSSSRTRALSVSDPALSTPSELSRLGRSGELPGVSVAPGADPAHRPTRRRSAVILIVLVAGLIAALPWFLGSPAPRNAPAAQRAILTNSIGMRFVVAEPGPFMQGSPISEPLRNSDERAVEVRLTRRFAVGLTEVTQAEWRTVMGEDYKPPEGVHPNEAAGLRFLGPTLPAYVSWFEASEFCRKLSLREGKLYRLPTESEWEYACRAGATSAYTFGQAIDPTQANIDAKASLDGPRAAGRPMPVASFPPNAWGLYDMHGNVMEWCADWKGAYELGPLTDPRGPASGELRVIRGGAWDTYAAFARSANRWANYPVLRTDYVGFRVVLEPDAPAPPDTKPFITERSEPRPAAAAHAGEVPAAPPTIALDPALPDYVPAEIMAQRLRTVGSDTMDRLIQSWEQRFTQWHSGVKLRHEGKGSGTAIRALLEGFAHLGPMSRPFTDSERNEFLSEQGYEPIQLVVAMDALAIYVHASNPVVQRGLSLEEVDAIYSSTRRAGRLAPLRTWGELGIEGEWRDARITLCGRNRASGTYGVFRSQVLRGGEFSPDVLELVGSAELVDRVIADRFAIGYSGIGYHRQGVSLVPIVPAPGRAPIAPGPESAHDGTYPLARPLYLAVDNPPDGSLSPLLREFIRFVYSRQGQELVVESGYYPVSAESARRELRRVGLSAP